MLREAELDSRSRKGARLGEREADGGRGEISGVPGDLAKIQQLCFDNLLRG